MSDVKPQAWGILAIAAGVMLWAGLPQVQAVRQAIELRSQSAADQAALAAVQVLATGGGADEAAAVAQARVASTSGLPAQVKPSQGNTAVTVRIPAAADTDAAFVSTAHYLPPEQPTQWNWRQRFAVKAAPVIVGSSCVRNCEPVQ